jgi:putative transposase
MMDQFSPHHPPHIYLDRRIYFITGRTVGGIAFFASSGDKELFREVLSRACAKFPLEMIAWVLLDNHYHLLMKLAKGTDLPRFVGNLHANSARLLNAENGAQKRQVWWNYWDYCIRDDGDYYRHLNYIHHNSVKHGYSKEMKDYQWSSYGSFLEKYGDEWMRDCFRRYPIIDFTPQGGE